MNLLLADQIGSIILLGVLVIFLIASPFVMKAKNKRDMDNAQKMLDGIKKGDNVLTASGVIGKVISIETKEGYKTVTIETGNEHHKGYLTLDIGAVYANLSNPVVEEPKAQEKIEEPKEEVAEQQVEEKAEVIEQHAEESVQEDVVKEQKKSSQKKSTKNSKNKK